MGCGHDYRFQAMIKVLEEFVLFIVSYNTVKMCKIQNEQRKKSLTHICLCKSFNCPTEMARKQLFPPSLVCRGILQFCLFPSPQNGTFSLLEIIGVYTSFRMYARIF